MKDLIEALQIFYKYTGDVYSPTHCEHDKLLTGLDAQPDKMTEEDRKRLEELSFHWGDGCWYSYRFGSA